MIWSGLTILAFIIFHLLHFTVKAGTDYASLMQVMPDGSERHDAWKMVIVGFSNPFVVIFYVIAMTLLCSHLSHGVASIFQTLGLRTKKTAGPITPTFQGLRRRHLPWLHLHSSRHPSFSASAVKLVTNHDQLFHP